MTEMIVGADLEDITFADLLEIFDRDFEILGEASEALISRGTRSREDMVTIYDTLVSFRGTAGLLLKQAAEFRQDDELEPATLAQLDNLICVTRPTIDQLESLMGSMRKNFDYLTAFTL